MNIQERTFGPQQYLTLKKSISTDQIADKAMYDEAGKKLGAFMERNHVTPTGPWSVLYFLWDEASKKAEIGIAFPVKNLENVDDPELTLISIPKTEAVQAVLHGSYENLGKVHDTLMNYVMEKSWDSASLEVKAIEEYVVNPMLEANPEKLVTNIIYLHQ